MFVHVQITENNVEIFELIENLSILSIKEQIGESKASWFTNTSDELIEWFDAIISKS